MELGRKKVRLGELLVNSGVLSNEQLQQALDNPARQGKKLGEFLVDEGIVSEDDLAKALSKQLDLDMIDLQSINVDKEVLNLVPVNVLKKNKIFPFAYKENNFNVLMVAMADPLDYNAIDDINIITNFQVEPVVATTRSIMLAIDKYFGQEEVTEALAAYAKEKKLDVVEDIATEENINSSPIVMLVKDMIEKAVRQRASDIHIEPMENIIRVRYRIDGALYERARYGVNVLSAIIATVLGTAASLGIASMSRKSRLLVTNITYIPVVNPEIITGISLMLLFVFFAARMNLEFGFVTLVIAHITFDVPYVILNVMPKFRQMDPNLFEAAQDLGCSPFTALRKVILPEIMPGVVSGFLMSFTFSLDDFVISYFTSGSTSQTLPITIYSMTRRKISPEINALSTLIFVVVVIVLVVKHIIETKQEQRNRANGGDEE